MLAAASLNNAGKSDYNFHFRLIWVPRFSTKIEVWIYFYDVVEDVVKGEPQKIPLFIQDLNS